MRNSTDFEFAYRAASYLRRAGLTRDETTDALLDQLGCSPGLASLLAKQPKTHLRVVARAA